MNLRTATFWIIAIISLSIVVVSTPFFYMTQVTSSVEFRNNSGNQDFLVCEEVWWSKNERIVYKTLFCAFQFLIPICIIVSIKHYVSIR